MATLVEMKMRYRWYLFCITVVVFLFGLVVFAFSGCDIRKRSEKRACKGGDVNQCLAVGSYYEHKTGGLIAFLMSHADTAMTYYNEACKHESAQGCERLIYLFKHGEAAKNLSVEITEIADAYIWRCSENEPNACDDLSGFIDQQGDWVLNRAASRFDKACKANKPQACFRLGLMHSREVAGLKNYWDEILPLFQKACAANIPNACKWRDDYQKAADRDAAKAANGSAAGSAADTAGGSAQ